jgi:hypothetical protein
MRRQRKSLDCPRCSGPMEAGFLIDEGDASKAVPKEQLEVTTPRCAYLESYA